MAKVQEYFTPQGDLHTLMQAHQIRSNPKRHAAAKAHGKKQLAAMKGVMDPEDNPAMGGDSGRDEATEKS